MERAKLPQDLRQAMPQLLDNGVISYPKGGLEFLQRASDIRVLFTLCTIFKSAPKSISTKGRNLVQIIFGLDHNNYSRQRTRSLINQIAAKHLDKLEKKSLWFTECFFRARVYGELYNNLIHENTVKWVACPRCLDNQHLRSISQMVGLLGVPQVTEEKKLYASLWDDVERSVLHPERAFDVLEIHPSLGDQLDWALTAVVTALQNTSRGVPPISLHTPEPLTENTRRLIAPYLNGTF